MTPPLSDYYFDNIVIDGLSIATYKIPPTYLIDKLELYYVASYNPGDCVDNQLRCET